MGNLASKEIPSCLHCGSELEYCDWIPFAWCDGCKASVQIAWEKEDDDDEVKPVERPSYYNSYIIAFFVDVPAAMCEVLTSPLDGMTECQRYRFPITKRYDREALTKLLYAASVQYNSDYVSDDHVFHLVSGALDSIWHGMRASGMRKLRPKKGINKEVSLA